MILGQNPLQAIQGFHIPKVLCSYLISVSRFFFHDLAESLEYWNTFLHCILQQEDPRFNCALCEDTYLFVFL